MTTNEPNGYVSRDQFLAKATELKEDVVELPDGSKIKLRARTSKDRIKHWDTWGVEHKKEKDDFAMPWRAFQLCALNADGSRMFDDSDADFQVVCGLAAGWGEDVAMRSLALIAPESSLVKN